MTNKRELNVRKPGEQVKEIPEPSLVDTVKLTEAQERAVEEEVRRRLAALDVHIKPKKPKEEELPDQADIDRSKIKRPVLSKDGWVVPMETLPRFMQQRGMY